MKDVRILVENGNLTNENNRFIEKSITIQNIYTGFIPLKR